MTEYEDGEQALVPPLPPKAPAETTAAEPRAPMPHNVTIALGMLSPLLAIVALGVSCESLELTREATRRGQQAYIGLSATKFQFHEEGVGPKGEQGIVYVDITVAVDNAGNTPATLFGAGVSWELDGIRHLLPAGTAVSTEVMLPLSSGEIRPHGTKEGSYRLRLHKDGRQLVMPIAAADQIQGITGGLDFSGQVAYKTVFSDEIRHARGCWRTMSHLGPLADCPADPETVHKALSR